MRPRDGGSRPSNRTDRSSPFIIPGARTPMNESSVRGTSWVEAKKSLVSPASLPSGCRIIAGTW